MKKRYRKNGRADYDRQLTEEQRKLDIFLAQYAHAVNQKRMLERRKRRIEQEFGYHSPAGGFDGMPREKGKQKDGVLAVLCKLDEIKIRIEDQEMQAIKRLEEIMDAIGFLEENSTERAIIENKYIDHDSWLKICNNHHMSRSTAIRHWKRGLDAMMKYKRVQDIVRRNTKAQNEHTEEE